MPYKSKTFLLADDDREDHELFKDAVLEMSPQLFVDCVTNGKEVVEYLADCDEDNLPCLIVLDYNMPKGNGPEVLDILSNHKRFSGIPKIIWSTSNSADYIAECISKGARAFFVKPNNFSQLKQVITEMMAFADL